MNAANEQLEQLSQLLQGLREGRARLETLCELASAAELRQALPQQFSVVLDKLVDSLQSSALFTEESCSFSREDLLDSLQMWIDKARARLDAGGH